MNAIIIYILVVLLGLAVGSFLNVLILRFDELKTIFTVRSHCPKCKKQIRWFDLVPFFSYFILQGKCRACKKDISAQYPIIEAITAIVFALIYWQFGFSWEALLLSLISSLMIIIAAYDVIHSEIPDVLSYITIVIGLGLVFLKLYNSGEIASKAAYIDYGYALLIGIGFLAILVLISRQKWMGAGDILVGAFMALILGYPLIILGILGSFVLGTVVSLVLMAQKKKEMKDTIPFAPFLVASTLITIFWGEKILNWYLGIV